MGRRDVKYEFVKDATNGNAKVHMKKMISSTKDTRPYSSVKLMLKEEYDAEKEISAWMIIHIGQKIQPPTKTDAMYTESKE